PTGLGALSIHYHQFGSMVAAALNTRPGAVERGNFGYQPLYRLFPRESYHPQRVGMPGTQVGIWHAAHPLSIGSEVGINPQIIEFSWTRPYLLLQPSIWMNHRLNAVAHQDFHRLLCDISTQRAAVHNLRIRMPHNHRPNIKNDRPKQSQLVG